MTKSEYIKCEFIIIYTNGRSQDISVNIKNDDNYLVNREFFRKQLINKSNVREVRI